jgi:hypothetical protein
MEKNQHTDGGDPEWCYPEEMGLDDESRCWAFEGGVAPNVEEQGSSIDKETE